ncbi:MAG: ribonuclease P protein component [Chitinophagaceae bacterium]|nr:ribonuclease P protein component [Chitinophagaceae bacterium]
MKKPFSLSKSERIKSKKAIETLFQSGEAFFSFPYRIVYKATMTAEANHPMLPPSALQMAVSVPKRFFKRAHDRNRIKRLTREAYRLQKPTLAEISRQQGKTLQLMLVYQGKTLPDFTTCFKAVEKIIQVLLKKEFGFPPEDKENKPSSKTKQSNEFPENL